MSDDNVTRLPARAKPGAEPLKAVPTYGGCSHRRYEVDERLAEVTCADCKAKLNPIWVLIQLANEDRILRDRWANLRASIQLMRDRRKTKCTHCGRLTRIPDQAGAYQIQALAEKIKSEEP